MYFNHEENLPSECTVPVPIHGPQHLLTDLADVAGGVGEKEIEELGLRPHGIRPARALLATTPPPRCVGGGGWPRATMQTADWANRSGWRMVEGDGPPGGGFTGGRKALRPAKKLHDVRVVLRPR